MRIITGQYKGRHFDIPRTFKARPTTDFAKENIFNVLMGYLDFEEIIALDLFAGTGSISLELLSRGCASGDERGSRPRSRPVHPPVHRKAGHESQLFDSRRRFSVSPKLPSVVRFHLCRPAVCFARIERNSLARLPTGPSKTRRRICFRAWKTRLLLSASSFRGTSGVWKRELQHLSAWSIELDSLCLRHVSVGV